MWRSYGKVFAVIGLYLAWSLFGTSAVALSPAVQMKHGGNTEVVVNIQPVRLILINDKGKIVQIISNSTTNVTPAVYKNSYTGPTLALSPVVERQYKALLSGLDLTQTGTIYQAGPSIIDQLARLGNYKSILFRAL